MKMDGAVMRMRALKNGIALPPGQTVELKPGSYHVMFFGLKAPFVKDPTSARDPGVREGRPHRRRVPSRGARRRPASQSPLGRILINDSQEGRKVI